MATIKNISGTTLVFPSELVLLPGTSLSVSKMTPELSDALAYGLLIEVKPMEATGETDKEPNGNGKKKK